MSVQMSVSAHDFSFLPFALGLHAFGVLVVFPQAIEVSVFWRGVTRAEGSSSCLWS